MSLLRHNLHLGQIGSKAEAVAEDHEETSMKKKKEREKSEKNEVSETWFAYKTDDLDWD